MIEKSILILVENKLEEFATLDAFDAFDLSIDRVEARICEDAEIYGNRFYNDLGKYHGVQVYICVTGRGSGGVGASIVSIMNEINGINICAVILIGTAFGTNDKKQKIGQVLVSEKLCLFKLERRYKKIVIPRSGKPHASTLLIDHFRRSMCFWGHDKCDVEFGTVFSGGKLVASIDYRNRLAALCKEAIGCEREASGVHAVCHEKNVHWIIVKGICGWVGGNKEQNKSESREKAAKNAADFVYFALNFASIFPSDLLPKD